MKHLRSLREYIDALRALDDIQPIDIEVDWNLEIGAIIRRSYDLTVGVSVALASWIET